MKQILHILKKDVRRFWLEILISVFILANFTWLGPRIWRQNLALGVSLNSFGLYGPGLVEGLLVLLIPISWWLLISRSLHEERLAGDRQFWITRPYEWNKLLSAKVLLVAAFVYLPLAVAQWWLLVAAGLHPANHIGALLYDWMLLTALPILPIAAIAAVTQNMARLVLTLLGVLMATAAIGAIIIALLQNGVMHSPIDDITFLDVPLVLVDCSAVVLLAYARRRIAMGRILLFALPVLLVVSQAFFSSNVMVNHEYPEIGSAGMQFSLKDNALPLESAHVAVSPRQLYIQIPMIANGIAPGDLWVGKGVRVTILAGRQTLWVSPWQEQSFYLPTNGDATLGFNVDRAIFDRVQPETVTLRLEIAFDQAHREQVDASRISFQDGVIPGLGVCSSVIYPGPSVGDDGKPAPAIYGLTCRSALRDPRLTYVETAFTRGPCQPAPGNGPSPLEVQGAWIGNLESEPSEIGINPLKVVPIAFSGGWINNSTARFAEIKQLCPGANITFSRYGLVRQLRTELTLENFRFPGYDKREDAGR